MLGLTVAKVVTDNWKGIAKAILIVIAALVGWHYASKLFTHDTVTVTHTVVDTTEVNFLRQQLELRDAQLAADTLAMQQFESMVNNAQTSKDSAIAFYEKIIRDLKDSTHPGMIVIPEAKASKVFTSTDANGFKYQDTVSVVYHYPPLNSFDVDLLLAKRMVITTHTDTSTITTVRSALPDIFVGFNYVDESMFAQADIVIGRWKFSAGYRVITMGGYVPGEGSLRDVEFGVAYKIF